MTTAAYPGLAIPGATYPGDLTVVAPRNISLTASLGYQPGAGQTSGMAVWQLSALAREWVGPISVEIMADSQPVDIPWQLALAPYATDPDADTWEDAYQLEDQAGVLVGPGSDHVLAVGFYALWVRAIDNPESPVAPKIGAILIR